MIKNSLLAQRLTELEAVNRLSKEAITVIESLLN